MRLAKAIDAAVAELEPKGIVKRIWAKDYTLWSNAPAEITNRLGWLTLPEAMRARAADIQAFADSVKNDFTYAVLLGMGGSSLGAEALVKIIGEDASFPLFHVLDSTLPAVIREVEEQVDPSDTLFIVSSKSGSTIEVLSLYKHFREMVVKAVGGARAGERFIAITDPGTSLERLAKDHRFRRIFLADPNVGGRYSIFSHFGLVPAALAGVDIAKLLAKAYAMQQRCGPSVTNDKNPGAYLGAYLAAMWRERREKVTFAPSLTFHPFASWAEQLIAESLGKNRKAIVPVATEPLGGAEVYGDDRVFINSRLENLEKSSVDTILAEIGSRGPFVLTQTVDDVYGIAELFYWWEFATAIAGAYLGVNPFDQPDVEAAKHNTGEVLAAYKRNGRLPLAPATLSPAQLLSQAKPGDYLAILAYLPFGAEVDETFAHLRERIMTKLKIATTVGLGPRYLHSTGQMHKGGPNNGLFLQIVREDGDDIPIPGEPYSFGVLAQAQALGDLQALKAAGRRVARLNVSGSLDDVLKSLGLQG
jgi:glucose-6-phosphate isomerase/transaldolase/glucose-6-phosphate isomerase